MPPPPRFSDERTQNIVIAVIMVAVLAVAVVLAWAFSAHSAQLTSVSVTSVRVDDVGLDVPTGWKRSVAHVPSPLYGDTQTLFTDPRDRRRTLLVTTLSPQPPVTPILMMNAVLRWYTTAQGITGTRGLARQSFRHDNVTGMLFIGDGQEQKNYCQFAVAVATQDGRHYVLALLQQKVPLNALKSQAQIDQVLLANRNVIVAVGDSLNLPDLQPADAGQIEAAGLSLQPLADGLDVYLPAGGTAGDPLVITTTEGDGGLALLRVRRVVDVSAAQGDLAARLQPQKLLAQRYQLIMDQPPPTAAQWTGKEAGQSAWRITISPGNDLTLSRELWFITLGHGRALLADVVCTPEQLERVRQWLLPVMHSMQAEPAGQGGRSGATTDAARVLDAALAVGQKVPAEQRKLLVKEPPPTWRYYLWQQGSDWLGCSASYDTQVTQGGKAVALDLQRWWIHANGQTQTTTQQSVLELAGGDFQQRTLRQDGGSQAVSGNVIRLASGKLSYAVLKDNAANTVWTVAAPPAFIRPALDDLWPLALLTGKPSEPGGAQSEPGRVQSEPGGAKSEPGRVGPVSPALVWMWQGDAQPPTPCWVEGRPAATDGSDSAVTAHLRIRPLMSLDADEYDLDKAGWVIGATLHNDSASPTGAIALTVRRSGRDQLVKHFAWAAQALQQMQKDVKDHVQP